MYIFILTFTPITEERLIFVTNKEMKDFKFIVADELENKSLFQIDVDVDITNLETTLIINPESSKQVLESFVKDVFL